MKRWWWPWGKPWCEQCGRVLPGTCRECTGEAPVGRQTASAPPPALSELSEVEFFGLITGQTELWRKARDAEAVLSTLGGTLRVATQAISRYVTPTGEDAGYAEGSGATAEEKRQIEILFAAGIWLAGKRGISQQNIARGFAHMLAEQFYRTPVEPPIP